MQTNPQPAFTTRPRPRRVSQTEIEVVACSICLDVQHNGSWAPAEHAIRALRTFEHPRVVRLRTSVVCESCVDAIRARRANP